MEKTIKDITERDKEKVLEILSAYHTLNVMYEDCMKRATQINEEIENAEKEVKKLKRKEERLMKSMTKEYGQFSLEELYEQINNEQ